MRNIVVYIFILIYSLLFIVLLPMGLIINTFSKKMAKSLVFSLAKGFSKGILCLSGIKVEVEGLENIPDENALYVSNHQSNLDPFLFMAFLPKKIAYIAKIETKKIPIFYQWMQIMGCLFIDRKDIRQSLRVIQNGTEILKNGGDLGIFPEGTRSVDGKILPFKAGSLKMAIKAQKTIVPIMIDGSYRLMDKGSIIVRPNLVKVKVLEKISVDIINQSDSKSLIAKIEEKIKDNLMQDVN